MIICSILLPQFIMGQITCIDSISQLLEEAGISSQENSTGNIPFKLINRQSTDSSQSNTAKIGKNKLSIKSSGSIRISGNFNHDPNQFYPLTIGFEGEISQSILSIPFHLESGIHSYNTEGGPRQGNFSIAFDRNLLLEGIKSILLQQQKEKFKKIFDSIKAIEMNFSAFDSIAQLLNDRENLFKIQEAYKMLDESIKLSSDTCLQENHSIDTSAIATAQNIIDKHLVWEHAYNRLLKYKNEIANSYKTLDIHKIISSFKLPLAPDELHEAQLIAEAKENGINGLNQFLSGLKTFAIGQLWLRESPITIYNKLANGLSFMYEFQGIYLGATLARETMNKLPYTGSGSQIQIAGSPKQFNVISQVLFGAGCRDKQFVEASLTSFTSSAHAAMQSMTAFHNSLVSVSTGIVRNGGFSGLAEITGSKCSFAKSGLPSEAQADEKTSQHFAYHFQVKEQFPAAGFTADIDYVSTGPLFKSYGNSNLPADARTIKTGVSQKIAGSKLIFSLRMDLRQYNVSSCFQLPFFQLNYAGELKWNYRGGNMTIGYNPVVSTSPSGGIKYKLQQFQFQIFKNYSIFNHVASGSIHIYATSNQLKGLPDSMVNSPASFLRCDFQQRISISSNFMLGTVLSVQAQPGTSAINNYHVSVTGNLKTGVKSEFMLGLEMTGFTETKYYGGSLTMRWNIFKNGAIHCIGEVNLNLESRNVTKSAVFHNTISYVQTF